MTGTVRARGAEELDTTIRTAAAPVGRNSNSSPAVIEATLAGTAIAG